MRSVSHFTVTLMILRGNPAILSWMRILALTLGASYFVCIDGGDAVHTRLPARCVQTHAETYEFEDEMAFVVCI